MSRKRRSGADVSIAAELESIASERCEILSQLSAIEELQARLNILLAVALENAAPPVKEEGRRLQSNTPMQRIVVDVRLLRSRLRRVPGLPFFVGFDTSTPPAHADALARSREFVALSAGKEAAGVGWSAAEDAALEAAVERVARMHAAERVFARFGAPYPAQLRPLGQASPHALADEPRALAQFESAVSFSDLRAAAARLPAADAAALVREAAAALGAPRGAILGALPRDFDWVRVAHGGFFPPLSVQSEHDCRVRWLAHLAPSARAAAAPASAPWLPAEDAALAVAAAAGGFSAPAPALPALAARRPLDCLRRYYALRDGGAPPARRFSTADDLLIARFVAEFGTKQWIALQQQLPAHSCTQLAKRYEVLPSPEARGLAGFSSEHEARLRLLIRIYGAGAWRELAAHFPERTDAALRAHWRGDRAAAPSLASADAAVAAAMLAGAPPFCDEEDAALCAAVAAHGSEDWAVVAAAASAATPAAPRRATKLLRWRYVHLMLRAGDAAGRLRAAPAAAVGKKRGSAALLAAAGDEGEAGGGGGAGGIEAAAAAAAVGGARGLGSGAGGHFEID